MRGPSAAAAALLALGVAPALAAPRGVPPEEAARYSADPYRCPDGKEARVNDDYCDCSDGSDEPGTSACADITGRSKFWCANAGHAAEHIPSSRVNDGICDCCDGSDEPGTTAGCADTCQEAATVHAKAAAEREQRRQAGLQAKATYLERAREILGRTRTDLEFWTREREAKEATLDAAKAKKEQEEEVERAEREAIKAKSEAEKVEWEQKQAVAKAEKEAELAARVRTMAALLQTHGELQAGGRVALLRPLTFKSGKAAAAGDTGDVVRVIQPEPAAPPAEGEEPKDDGKPRGPSYEVKLHTGLHFIAYPGDIAPDGNQAEGAARLAKELADQGQETAAAGAKQPDPVPVENPPPPACLGWRQTGGCDPDGGRESAHDRDCNREIPDGASGYCECAGGKRHGYKCSHEALTCQHVCETEAPGTLIRYPCPVEFPFPIRRSPAPPEASFVGRVCYNAAQHAQAGTGPCGTWCARDSDWYDTVKCRWGCNCGRLCPGVPEDDDEEDAEAAKPAGPVVEEIQDPPEPTFTVDDGSSHERPEAKAAREAFHSIESDIESAKNKVEEAQTLLDANYGPDHVFLPLRDECFEFQVPDYTYKLCPFKTMHQGGTNMGHWKGWGQQTYGDWGGKDDLSVMRYEGGQSCWSGPQRSCQIKVVCGVENKLHNVQEPSMCTYTAVFETPVACV